MVAFARGDVAAATGLMAALAASSAVLAPLLLRALLPMAGMDGSQVDATAVAGTLMVTQLAPLAATIVVHERRPDLAARPQVVALNKLDITEVRERWDEIRAAFADRGIQVFAVSAATGHGVKELLNEVWRVSRNAV